MADQTTPAPAKPDIWHRLQLRRRPIAVGSGVQNANTVHEKQLSKMDKVALGITVRVGSMSFFIVIFIWTVLWCGYNLLATQVPSLGWKSFDPFPAFVAYLLISNVIQILLMPLIMVGQNVQSLHSEIRAELDFEINQKAEKEVIEILRGLEHNTDLLIQLMKHQNCSVDEAAIRALSDANDANKLKTGD